MAGLGGFGDFKLLEGGLGLNDVGNSLSGASDIAGSFGDFSQLSNSLGQSGYSGLFNSIDGSTGLSNSFMDSLPSLSGLGSSAMGALDTLGKYKTPIELLGNVGLGIANYNTTTKQQEMMEDYYNSLMAEQKRQVAKEETATDNMTSGFKASNYYNV